MKAAARSLMALGALYALFSALLYAAGVAPKAILLPVEPTSYYAWQTVFVGPLFCVLTAIYVSVVWLLARGDSDVSWRQSFEALTPLYAWPLLALFVVPDLAVYLIAGHAALAPAMRYYAPIVPIVIVALTSMRAKTLYGVGGLRATGAALLGLIVQGIVGGSVLR